MHVVYPAIVSALLFSIGVYGVLARRNTILVLMSVELMLNAVNLNLVTFDVWLRDRLHSGQVLTLFVIVIAAAEVGLGLAIILALYRNRQTVDLDRLRALAEPVDTEAAPTGGTDTAAGRRTGTRAAGDGNGDEERARSEDGDEERARSGDRIRSERHVRSRDPARSPGAASGPAAPLPGQADRAGEIP